MLYVGRSLNVKAGAYVARRLPSRELSERQRYAPCGTAALPYPSTKSVLCAVRVYVNARPQRYAHNPLRCQHDEVKNTLTRSWEITQEERKARPGSHTLYTAIIILDDELKNASTRRKRKVVVYAKHK